MAKINPATQKEKATNKSRLINVFIGAACLIGIASGFFLESMVQGQIQDLPPENRVVQTQRPESKGIPKIRVPSTDEILRAKAKSVKKKEHFVPGQPLFNDMGNYTGYARAYDSWPESRPFPCFPTDGDPKRRKGYLMQLKPTEDGAGLFFHRPLKTGSTTVAGTVMRIAHRKAHLVQGKPGVTSIVCKHRSNHGAASSVFKYQDRDKEKSFLFSIIRDPTKRAISQFFHFMVVVHQMEPTDPVFQREMNAKFFDNYYIRDLALQVVPDLPARPDHTKFVKEIIDGYDFIAITERLDESLVVFKMLLHLELEDILYVRERSQGGFSNGPPGRPCLYVWPSFVTDGMKAYFASDKWKKQIEGDTLLYEAAKKSLDLTIDRLGRARFEGELSRFKAALKIAQEVCGPRAVSMCREDGSVAKNTTCYIWGEGCSHDCLDEIKIP